jgi:DNA-3-methyladenine glycosylase II
MFFAYDERQTEYLKSRDATLGAVIDRLGHIDRTVDPDLFQAVVRHIVGQQISMKAQKTVWDRLRAKLGEVTP